MIVLVTVFSLAANAQEPVPLARENTPGEPHHHVKIENEYVRVYYVEVPPHENTQLHQHDHDYIYVSLGPADVVNAILNKPEIHLQLKDGETHFTRGGFAHVARNLADTPFRNITIELLKPQGEARNICSDVVPGLPSIMVCAMGCAVRVDNKSEAISTSLFATDKAAAQLYSLGPKAVVAVSQHNYEKLIVALDRLEIEREPQEESSRALEPGDFLWLAAGTDFSIKNVGAKTGRFLQFYFKKGGV